MSPFRLREAARSIRVGATIAYPTEAVYGLGCNPLDPDAVYRILALKQRPVTKGLILIAADFVQLQPFVQRLPQDRMQEILASWPGPNTWLLPCVPGCPIWLSGRHDTLAVRVTDHPIAAALCRAARSPLVSTSANRAGRRPATTALQVRSRFGRSIDAIVPGAVGGLTRPTTIRDGSSGTIIRAA